MSRNFDDLPSFDKLPSFGGLPGCAWEVWGKGDELGTVNLLTDEVVARAAKEEIQTGKRVTMNWPVNFPSKPMFNRRPPEHKVVSRTNPPRRASNDDELHINTQSGTQWDGLRHFGIFSEKCFYQGVPASEIPQGVSNISDPTNVDKQAIKLGIHNWAQHGICGRGVLVDLVKFYTEDGTKPLPYDPWKTHPIPVSDIKAAADKQGVVFRPADILLLRVGFMQVAITLRNI
ncbi:hypothetical protein M422DRAFT_185389 [Sphaerobolus stellatus SS14]|uniref:Unplaced genomic scaffold SPHSTscaffold_161, whole genome shotgun sequence n=1 Tax=Sphaerobolus stellatus (strain SS14) TaxID=990650 RepID=A0A0C9V2V6_SPHS4|nr:hypothetical protein M422DRAFT_185389 [Sphaerobolus stellatus SS14]